ncbi:solute carrier family 23 protein [Exiguobacterium profundum]|uniref:uracil-xanthine permease family protein n=1 Tax=Exiguobacterium profundum TaxID=307643 RepID=UPI0029C40EC0|nr:solute carrier family 23 protein [Exiguobacterium profundum]MDX5980970.1 solute carrier family 23 protein [Exiguobacterium profundum]
MKQPVLHIHERPAHFPQWLLFSLQHVFAMFGATILVPILTGLNTSVALVASGVATLSFLAITRFKVPTYLGSSFAYIAPIIAVSQQWGVEAALFGGIVAGSVYGVVSLIIYKTGVNWLLRLLPPVVVGPVIMVIGLSLAPVAIDMSMNQDGAYNGTFMTIALLTLGITMLAMTKLKGVWGAVPILFGIVGGYAVAAAFGIIDYSPIQQASLFQLPDFTMVFVDYMPMWQVGALLAIVPVALVTMTEHIGDQMVTSKIIGRETMKDPGLHRTLLGDGVGKAVASALGGPPCTTYGENNGVMAITRVYSVYVIAGAALMAISFGFLGHIEAFISTIPNPVKGGISILLFGVIASNGLRTMVESKVDLAEKRNLIISSVILVIGLGGAMVEIGSFPVQGMALATVVGILLNAILPLEEDDTAVEVNTTEETKQASNF